MALRRTTLTDSAGSFAAKVTIRSIVLSTAAEPSDDGTPSDSINEVFSRVRNTVAKIEQTYGSGDFVLIAGDGDVLSILAAAACGVDLREHSRFELRPGEFVDLRELQADVRAGRFTPREAAAVHATIPTQRPPCIAQMAMHATLVYYVLGANEPIDQREGCE